VANARTGRAETQEEQQLIWINVPILIGLNVARNDIPKRPTL